MRLTLSSQTTSAPGETQPPASAEAIARSPRPRRVGRVEEHEVGRGGVTAAEPGRVAADDPGPVVGRQQADVAAQERQRPRSAVDEGRLRRAARQRLEPERAGAGEEVEHDPLLGRRRAAVVAVGQQVEEALAHPVRGRTQLRGRVAGAERRQHQPAVPAAYDPHRPPRPAGFVLIAAAIRSSLSGRSLYRRAAADGKPRCYGAPASISSS